MAAYVNAAADCGSCIRREHPETSARRAWGNLAAVEGRAQAVAFGARLAQPGPDRLLFGHGCRGELSFQPFDLLPEAVEVLCDQTDRHGRSNLRLQIVLPGVYIKKGQGSRFQGFEGARGSTIVLAHTQNSNTSGSFMKPFCVFREFRS